MVTSPVGVGELQFAMSTSLQWAILSLEASSRIRREEERTNDYIDACCREAARVLSPSGYLMRWVDTFGLARLNTSESQTSSSALT